MNLEIEFSLPNIIKLMIKIKNGSGMRKLERSITMLTQIYTLLLLMEVNLDLKQKVEMQTNMVSITKEINS